MQATFQNIYKYTLEKCDLCSNKAIEQTNLQLLNAL